MRRFRLLVIFGVFFVFIQVASAQPSRRDNYWSVGLSLNTFNYFGDLAPLTNIFSTEIKFTRPNFGLEVSKKIGSRFHLRGAFSYGRLKGDDNEAADPAKEESIGRWGRNLSFRNDVYELSAVLIYEFLPSRGRFYRRRYISPYLLAGIGGFYHNPKGKVPDNFNGPEAGEWVNLRPLRTEGQGLTRQFGPDAGTQYDSQYSLIQMAVPLGYGVRFRLSDRLDLSFEMAFRLLFFDHIDDVGGRYPDIRDLESDLARTMYDRSAEAVGVLTGDARTPTSATGSATSLYGIDQGNESILVDFPGYTRWASYGLRGQIRGNTPSENDMYIVTGFHLNYILTTKRYPRYKSRF